jgi:hypothetical protein
MLIWVVPCVMFLIPLPWLAPYVSTYTVLPLSFMMSYGIFINFPILVKVTSSRPLYYDDLKDDRYVDGPSRNRFKAIFVAITQVIFAIILMGLIYYYSQKYPTSTLSGFEIVGVMGGFISLFKSAAQLAGTIMLKIVQKMKARSTDPPSTSRARAISFALSDEEFAEHKTPSPDSES